MHNFDQNQPHVASSNILDQIAEEQGATELVSCDC